MIEVRIGPLVRAIGSQSVAIWVELSQPCTVICHVTPAMTNQDGRRSASVTTVTVGGRYYAVAFLEGLLSATWYDYQLLGIGSDGEETLPVTVRQCFRTLDPANAETTTLRVAYGSCRRSNHPEDDALSAFGNWLLATYEARETMWPQLLLLIGDQIYADQPPDEVLKAHPRLQEGAATFADFALLYEYAWSRDPNVRQVLAALPTFMMFDDHEVTNNWYTQPTWRARVLQAGKEELLVDGLVAYWLYQGWGNLYPQQDENHPLLQIMHMAGERGEDALPALRARVQADVTMAAPIRWHYTIPTQPPIFVANARTERTAVFSENTDELYAPTQIMSAGQMSELRAWLQGQQAALPLIVSSVPVLLPPVIGLGEYIMGYRFWTQQGGALHTLGLRLAQLQQRVADKANFDHWPLYSTSWHALVQLLQESGRDLLVLSGDVHFSYAMCAQPRHHATNHLYQFVSTPLQNALDEPSDRQIKLQARISRWNYGGLHTRVLPLQSTDQSSKVHANLLFQNTLAMVTLQQTATHSYNVQQEYLGIIDGQMKVVARTLL